MALRIHLYNSVLGPLTIIKADPIGINDLTQIIKRSDDYQGLIFEVIFNFEFIKEGRSYLKLAKEKCGGIDAIVVVTIYEWEPNLRDWEFYAMGQVDFKRYELREDRVIVNIEQTGIERRILNLLETEVNMETLTSENLTPLPPLAIKNPEYHSKAILKELRITPTPNEVEPHLGEEYLDNSIAPVIIPGDGFRFIPGNVDINQLVVGDLGLNVVNISELEEGYPVPYGYTDVSSNLGIGAGTESGYSTVLLTPAIKGIRNVIHEATEVGILDIVGKATYKHTLTSQEGGGDIDAPGTSGAMGNVEIWLWLEHRGADDNVKSLEKVGQWTGARTTGNRWESPMSSIDINRPGINAAIGDKFYLFETVRIFGRYRKASRAVQTTIAHAVYIQANPKETYLAFKSKTIAESSNVSTVLLFEAVKRCCEYYTNVQDCFYSDLLGRTDLGYAQDGEASLIGLTSGNKLRGINKPVLISLKDILEFINARFCVGFSFEIINGKWMFRLEKLSYYYRKNEVVLDLGPVYDIKKKTVEKGYWNMFIYGYSGKLDIGQVNAIDEFNTLRKSSLPIVNTKNKLDVSTKIRASGNQIEFQRRLKGTTKDSKLDDENFVVSLVRNGDGYKTKTTEGYIRIENVQFAPTGYNYDLSPGRCLQAWRPYIASCLFESLSKTVTFRYGEINYEMISQRDDEPFPIFENGSYDLTNDDPYFNPENYEFSFRLTRDQLKLLKLNPFAVIRATDRFDFQVEGYINHGKGIEHDPNRGTATFELLAVHRKQLS